MLTDAEVFADGADDTLRLCFVLMLFDRLILNTRGFLRGPLLLPNQVALSRVRLLAYLNSPTHRSSVNLPNYALFIYQVGVSPR
jgi:hypothetical protein